jgi:hypothetical protein
MIVGVLAKCSGISGCDANQAAALLWQSSVVDDQPRGLAANRLVGCHERNCSQGAASRTLLAVEWRSLSQFMPLSRAAID